MRVGVLGGTFDPIHLAHLIMAEQARIRMALEHVVFIPTGEPWLKAVQPATSPQVRLDMVRQAVACNPHFRVSSVEVDRPGPSYSVDTLDVLRREEGPDAELYFILGMDAVADLPSWHAPERFLELCTPVVFARTDYGAARLDDLEHSLPGAKDRVMFLEGPVIEISSTDIRQRVAQGVSIRYLVTTQVERFITEHGLYRQE